MILFEEPGGQLLHYVYGDKLEFGGRRHTQTHRSSNSVCQGLSTAYAGVRLTPFPFNIPEHMKEELAAELIMKV